MQQRFQNPVMAILAAINGTVALILFVNGAHRTPLAFVAWSFAGMATGALVRLVYVLFCHGRKAESRGP